MNETSGDWRRKPQSYFHDILEFAARVLAIHAELSTGTFGSFAREFPSFMRNRQRQGERPIKDTALRPRLPAI
jgi:hypothetical protein